MIYIVKEKDSFLTSAREFHKLWGLKPVEFAQIDEDLRRRCAVVFAVIVAPNISISRCFRVVADDMKVIEFEFRIGHHLPSRGERISDNTSGQLRCDTESATHYVQTRMRNTLL